MDLLVSKLVPIFCFLVEAFAATVEVARCGLTCDGQPTGLWTWGPQDTNWIFPCLDCLGYHRRLTDRPKMKYFVMLRKLKYFRAFSVTFLEQRTITHHWWSWILGRETQLSRTCSLFICHYSIDSIALSLFIFVICWVDMGTPQLAGLSRLSISSTTLDRWGEANLRTT